MFILFFMTKFRFDRWKYMALFTLIPFFIGFGFFLSSDKMPNKPTVLEEAPLETQEAHIPLEKAYPHKVPRGSSLYLALRALNVSPVAIHEIVEAAKPFANLARLKPGARFNVVSDEANKEGLSGIYFLFSPIEKLEITRGPEGWVARKIEEKVDSRVVTFRGVVKSTLWESAITAKMDPNLTAELAEIFAWQVDFAREVQVNDRWRLSVEQTMVNGKTYGWGRILAAEYENSGELYQAVLLRTSDEDFGYFAPDGSSLKRMFLKSPIKFGRISSRFQRKRFHPILKVNRPHLGVDYAAPTGTPIRAVGDGVVILAARRGGGGNTIKIRHNSVYKTAYKHLSGYAKGIRRGAKVRQGQIIGYVGSTGMSTGPHLHFEFYRNGQYVDPLGQKFPSADPVPKNLLSHFKAETPIALASLPEWERIEASRSPASESVDGEAVEAL